MITFKKKRKGITLIEAMATVACLSIVVLGSAATSTVIRSIEANTRGMVYLRTHNLNCMERLRQECLYADGNMLSFYGDDKLGSLTVETNAYLEQSGWDHFNVYSVVIESKVRDSKLKLKSKYVMTDIGAVEFGDVIH